MGPGLAVERQMDPWVRQLQGANSSALEGSQKDILYGWSNARGCRISKFMGAGWWERMQVHEFFL